MKPTVSQLPGDERNGYRGGMNKEKPGMTFLEALKTGRPMRRKSQWSWCQWRHLGHDNALANKQPLWRALDTGAPLGISREDYFADDWEVMP